MIIMLMVMVMLMLMAREEEDEDHPAVDLKGFTKVHQSWHQYDHHHDHYLDYQHNDDDHHHAHHARHDHQYQHHHENLLKVLNGVAEGPVPGMQVLRFEISLWSLAIFKHDNGNGYHDDGDDDDNNNDRVPVIEEKALPESALDIIVNALKVKKKHNFEKKKK